MAEFDIAALVSKWWSSWFWGFYRSQQRYRVGLTWPVSISSSRCDSLPQPSSNQVSALTSRCHSSKCKALWGCLSILNSNHCSDTKLSKKPRNQKISFMSQVTDFHSLTVWTRLQPLSPTLRVKQLLLPGKVIVCNDYKFAEYSLSTFLRHDDHWVHHKQEQSCPSALHCGRAFRQWIRTSRDVGALGHFLIVVASFFSQFFLLGSIAALWH